jgi:hypothetical protein
MKWIRSLGDIFLNKKLNSEYFRPYQRTDIPDRQVAIVFNADTLEQQKMAKTAAEAIQRKFALPGHLFGFVPRKIGDNVTFGFPHFSLNDMKWSSIPHNKKLDLFLQRPYRACINLDLDDHLALHYLCHQVMAKHKLAFSPSHPNLYDIVLDKGETVDLQDMIDKTLDIFAKISLR